MKTNNHKDLKVWQKSMDLVDKIYTLTKKLPSSELYGLSSQMQRAAVAIPSNIAEGSKRNHRNEFIQFLGIANASAAELETQLLITKRQYGLDSIEDVLLLVDEILRMLYALIQSTRERRPSSD